MSLVGFKPTISAGERRQTFALDGAATGTGIYGFSKEKNLLQLLRNRGFSGISAQCKT
jgi:hypothetical protein